MFIKTEGVAILLKCSKESVEGLVKEGVLTSIFSLEKYNIFDERQIIKYRDLKREVESFRYKNQIVPKHSMDELLRRKKILETQKEKVYQSFSQYPKTMRMVANETGILRSSICKIVANLRLENLIELNRKEVCKASKFRAGYYTTNQELFSTVKQLSLF